jgi:outer membrane receptor protein involved in Fe transport
VGRAQLDNTGDRRLSADPYAWSDLSVRLDLARWVRVGSPRLRLQVGNVFDAERVWPSGYSYPYLVEDAAGTSRLEGIPYYYPMAPRHAVLGVELSF